MSHSSVTPEVLLALRDHMAAFKLLSDDSINKRLDELKKQLDKLSSYGSVEAATSEVEKRKAALQSSINAHNAKVDSNNKALLEATTSLEGREKVLAEGLVSLNQAQSQLSSDKSVLNSAQRNFETEKANVLLGFDKREAALVTQEEAFRARVAEFQQKEIAFNKKMAVLQGL